VGSAIVGSLPESSHSRQSVSSECATRQRLAERRAASGSRLKPDVENITAKSNYNDDVVVTATLTIPGF